jgi:adenosylmethionine-8-amino-7-oxononanoate aminotransferase
MKNQRKERVWRGRWRAGQGAARVRNVSRKRPEKSCFVGEGANRRSRNDGTDKSGKGDEDVSEWGNLIPRSYKTEMPLAVRGEGIYIYDESGRAYIDGCSGALLSSVGHGNKEIVAAMTRQLETLEFAHPSRWMNAAALEAAKEAASIAPADLRSVWFVSGGSEAIESAVKMVRQYFVERDGLSSSKSVCIARWASYHGSTLGAMGIGGNMARRRMFSPLFLEGPKIEPHYCYRCPFGLEHPSCDLRCAHALEQAIRRIGPQYVAAFLAEPVVGSTVGALNPPEGYWPLVREICSRYDVLLVADEIMTGVGRTGKPFCVDHWKVVPDIICSAKALSGGYAPVGAMFVRDDIVEVLRSGSGSFMHGHTYNANPVTGAAVAATLRYMKAAKVFENAAVMGERLEKALAPLADLSLVGEVRGMGLMRGIELVENKATKKPFAPEKKAAAVVTGECMKRGLVVYPGSGQIDGVAGDQFMVAPPLIVTQTEVDEIVGRLEEGLRAAENRLRS